MAVAGAISTWTKDGKGFGRMFENWPQLLRQELDQRVIWTPMFMMIGIWAYFSLPREPDWRLVCAAVLLIIASLIFLKRSLPRTSLPLLALVAGFALADFRAAMIATPVLQRVERNVSVDGYIANIERRGRGNVVVLDTKSISVMTSDNQPRRLRINLKKSKLNYHIGDRISLIADLRPLPRPAKPRAFDYGRSLYFESIGGVGNARSEATILSYDVPWRFRLRRVFHDIRAGIGAHIREHISGPNAAFADAIISGERAQIPKDMNQSLISSGLSHILSISGLHMSLVAGGVFWFVRALLALSPRMALQYPIKKYAAVAALAAGLFYMLLADGGAATERSYIMIAVVFFAVLVGRPALSLHNLAIAALVILVLQPEQAVSASFQMSFLAVMGLGAFFAWWQRPKEREFKLIKYSQTQRMLRDGIKIAAASILTSLIAGALTTIAAGHHFGRVSPYGVMANSMALPIVSLIVMPAALIATLLMPLGLEGLPLKALDFGLTAVMWVSNWVATLPGATGQMQQYGAVAAALLALGASFICLAQSKLRWLGIVPALLGVLLATQQRGPDILIEEQTRNVAIRNNEGRLVPLSGKQAKFSVERWLLAEGDNTKLQEAARRAGWSCASGICTAEIGSRKIAVLQRAAEAAKPCLPVDIVIAEYPLRRSCKGKLATIDRFDVWRSGAHALTFEGDGVSVQTARGEQGLRPWSYEPKPKSIFNRTKK